jgi:hypothetical protein
MIITTNYGSFVLFFSHTGNATTCQIFEGADPKSYQTQQAIALGTAYRSAKDQFCRAKGRKVSLARAIRQLVPRDEYEKRLEIWRAYFKQLKPTDNPYRVEDFLTKLNDTTLKAMQPPNLSL